MLDRITIFWGKLKADTTVVWFWVSWQPALENAPVWFKGLLVQLRIGFWCFVLFVFSLKMATTDSSAQLLKIGHRVTVQDYSVKGIVKWKGMLEGENKLRVGIALDTGVGKNNGVVRVRVRQHAVAHIKRHAPLHAFFYLIPRVLKASNEIFGMDTDRDP